MSGTVYMGDVNLTTIASSSSLSITSSTGNIQLGPYTFPSLAPVENTILISDGTGNLSFVPVNLRTAVTTSTYSITSEDDIIAITVAQDTTLTLPPPSSRVVGEILYIVKEVPGTDSVTVNPSGTELISGLSSFIFSSSYGTLKLITNGTNWFVL